MNAIHPHDYGSRAIVAPLLSALFVGVLLFGMLACGSGSTTETTTSTGGDDNDDPPDTTAPTVTFVSPSDGTTGIATNASASAMFSEPLKAGTVGTATFRLQDNTGTPVAATIGYNGASRTATLTPNADLAGSTLHTATLTTGIQDQANNPLASGLAWSFTTGAGADITAPTVVDTIPANGASSIATDRAVSAVFDEDMAAATIAGAAFTLVDNLGNPVAGTTSYAANGAAAMFRPTAALAVLTTYTARVTTAATDAAGNPLAADEVWTFTTGLLGDLAVPTVVSTVPLAAAINIATNTVITAVFSEPLDPATVNPTSVLVEDPLGNPITGTVSFDLLTQTLTFVPDAALPLLTIITVRITSAVLDLAGNALVTPFVWVFTTVTV